MLCPVDGRELQMTHRDGIELDYCPTCRGVWFDRGELDKVIERSNEQFRASRPQHDEHQRSESRRDEGSRKPEKKKKMSSFLSDLLEFG